MIAIKILTISALLGSIAWMVHSPDYEPAVASITSLSACIAAFIVDRKRQNSAALHQSVTKGSIGVQAGGNISLGNINTKDQGK
ncbi:MAG: hypothetical protein HY253_01245 [Burkholderiales bacterium]|nr:hypothetical protein [Burkholderiales bacterium]